MTTETKQLRLIEQRIWKERRRAHKAYYAGPKAPKRDAYSNGAGWSQLATYDDVLSIFREVLDGAGGAGHEQCKAQQKRVKGRTR